MTKIPKSLINDLLFESGLQTKNYFLTLKNQHCPILEGRLIFNYFTIKDLEQNVAENHN